MKKEPINPDSLMNELKGKSTYFKDEQANKRTNEQPSAIVDEIDNTPPERRTKRMSFDGYVDHADTIREIQHAYYKRTGKDLPTSRIVREALEQYLPKLLEALGGKED